MKFLFSAIVFTLFIPCLLAQDASKELEKLSAGFSSAHTISMDMVYTMYKDESEKSIISTSAGSFKKYKANTYYRLDQMEMVNGDKFSLMVHHDTKVLMLNPRNRADVENQAQLWNFDFAKASGNYSSVTLNKIDRKTAYYSILLKTGDFTRIDIAFKPEDNTVVWVKFFSRTEQVIDDKGTVSKPVVKVEYRNLQLNGSVDHSFFSTRKFLNENSGAYSLPEKYKDYQFFNLLADNN